MKFNSILLILLCLLQALICSDDGLNEQTLRDAASRILKYAKVYYEKIMKFEDTEFLHDWQMYCPSIDLDNILFEFDENGNLHIKYVNLILDVSGKYSYGIGFSHGSNSFIATLQNFYWNHIFKITKKELENGKLDVNFTQVASSEYKYNIELLTKNANNIEIEDLNLTISLEDSLKILLKKSIDFKYLTYQMLKISQLILETVKSDLK